METLRPYLELFAQHLYLLVFLSSLIDATGIPFPGRIILVLAGTVAAGDRALAAVILCGASGAVLGDHLLYLGGMLGGPRWLSLYCRLTLGSARCIENTVAYFRRFGPPTIMLGRFSFSVRLFAAVLAGSGNIAYRRFVTYDLLGALVYATIWVGGGYIIGEQWHAIVALVGGPKALLILGPTVILAILGFRLGRRLLYGAATAGGVETLRLAPDRPGGAAASSPRIEGGGSSV
jgi:membrane protein DedA with SNARE-associated domain